MECYPEGKFVLKEPFEDSLYSHRWGWTQPQFNAFLARLIDMQLVVHSDDEYKIKNKAKWYDTGADKLAEYKAIAVQVIIEFNKIMGRRVSLSPLNERNIIRRIREGSKFNPPTGLDQFIAVFKYMKKEWEEDPKFQKYLKTPDTLCSDKFFKYLEMARDAHRGETRPAFTVTPQTNDQLRTQQPRPDSRGEVQQQI